MMIVSDVPFGKEYSFLLPSTPKEKQRTHFIFCFESAAAAAQRGLPQVLLRINLKAHLPRTALQDKTGGKC